MTENSKFIDVRTRTPQKPGVYTVKVVRNNEEKIVRKTLFLSSNGAIVWMGGMRPFCESDEVIAWIEPEVGSE